MVAVLGSVIHVMLFLVTMHHRRHFIDWTHQSTLYIFYFVKQYVIFVNEKKEDASASEWNDDAGASSLKNNIMRMALSSVEQN